jgi:hypothetical protein
MESCWTDEFVWRRRHDPQVLDSAVTLSMHGLELLDDRCHCCSPGIAPLAPVLPPFSGASSVTKPPTLLLHQGIAPDLNGRQELTIHIFHGSTRKGGILDDGRLVFGSISGNISQTHKGFIR